METVQGVLEVLVVAACAVRGPADEVDDVVAEGALALGAAPGARDERQHGRDHPGRPVAGAEVGADAAAEGDELEAGQVATLEPVVPRPLHVEQPAGAPVLLGARGHGRHEEGIADEHRRCEREDGGAGQGAARAARIGAVEVEEQSPVPLRVLGPAPVVAAVEGDDDVPPRLPAAICLGQARHRVQALGNLAREAGRAVPPGPPAAGNQVHHAAGHALHVLASFVAGPVEQPIVAGEMATEQERFLQPSQAARLGVGDRALDRVRVDRDQPELERGPEQGHADHAVGVEPRAARAGEVVHDARPGPGGLPQHGAELVAKTAGRLGVALVAEPPGVDDGVGASLAGDTERRVERKRPQSLGGVDAEQEVGPAEGNSHAERRGRLAPARLREQELPPRTAARPDRALVVKRAHRVPHPAPGRGKDPGGDAGRLAREAGQMHTPLGGAAVDDLRHGQLRHRTTLPPPPRGSRPHHLDLLPQRPDGKPERPSARAWAAHHPQVAVHRRAAETGAPLPRVVRRRRTERAGPVDAPGDSLPRLEAQAVDLRQ